MFNNTNKIIEIGRNNNKNIEKELFYKYLNENEPIIFTKFSEDWEALSKWNDPNYLINIIGNDHIIDVNKCSFGGYYKDIIKMKFSEFISKSINNQFNNFDLNGNKIKKVNKPYLRNFEMFEDFPIFNKDINCDIIFDKDKHNLIVKRTFIGSVGSATSFHIDTGDNLVTVIKGCKFIVMISPNDSKFLDFQKSREIEISFNKNDNDGIPLEYHPAFSNCKYIYKTLLRKGESLFIPNNWIHYVHNISDDDNFNEDNNNCNNNNNLIISVSCWGKLIYDLVV
ncbi:hypothetical protein ACTFIY_011235 [Dictyostelium cf. discoideum]